MLPARELPFVTPENFVMFIFVGITTILVTTPLSCYRFQTPGHHVATHLL
jgi:hypothetical protein